MREILMIAVAVLLFAYFTSPAHTGSGKVTLKVQAVHDGDIIVRPYVSPVLNFKLSSGKLPVKDEVLVCQQDEIIKQFGDHHDAFVTLNCHDGATKLQLQGVFLANND